MLSPLRVCIEPSCRTLVRAARCGEHLRKSAHARGYDRVWQKLANKYRRLHPMCAECSLEGRAMPVECVDHIVPHRGDDALRLAGGNLQSLCWSCHSKKTRRGE